MAAEATPLSAVRFLTVAEVAAIMRVSKMTVYRLVHSGDLEAIRVGRSFRVPERAVDQYLSQMHGRRRPRWSDRGTLWHWRAPGRVSTAVKVRYAVARGIDRGWSRGFCNQEAAQADGEEEAPQAAAQDPGAASQAR